MVKDLNVLYDYMGANIRDVDRIFYQCFNIKLVLTQRFICDAGIPLAAAELQPFRELLERPVSIRVDPSIWESDEDAMG